MRQTKLFTVYEYDKLYLGSLDSSRSHTITQKTFDEVIKLASTSVDVNEESLNQFIETGYSDGKPYLRFKNYVGTINLPSGFSFEILPKIARENDDFIYARKTVLKMLEASSCIRYKTKQNGTSDLEKLPIFEIYIRLFIDEVNELMRKGLKSSYSLVEENSTSLKGKIIFPKQIVENYAHKERFYIEHDVFDLNRPENKIIKSAALLLKNITKSQNNSRDLKRILLNMDSIMESNNIKEDLSKCLLDRNVAEYEYAIKYARIFLLGYSFSIYGSQEDSVSLLFPMELLYQEYVYQKIASVLAPKGWKVRKQDTTTFLFTSPKKFQLRPDIVASSKEGTIIFDTKWKRIDKEADISQGDIYQMFVYHKRYPGVKKVILLYPSYSNSHTYAYKTNDDVLIEARFVKLLIEDNFKDFLDNVVNSAIL